MEDHKTTRDIEFVKENADSFEKSETITDFISKETKSAYCYVFLMIKADGKGGCPLHIASNMDGESLASLLGEAYNKVSSDGDLMPGGQGNA